MVVSDYRLPRFGAPEALALFQESGLEAPFIVVSGKLGEDAAVEVMKAGADDFLTKDNLARLCPTVERSLAEAEERRHADEELHRRNAILEAVRFAAEYFLGNPTDRERGMEEVLGRLGQATETSRVYVFRNYIGDDGRLWNSQLHKWVAPGLPYGIPEGPDGSPITDFPIGPPAPTPGRTSAAGRRSSGGASQCTATSGTSPRRAVVPRRGAGDQGR